MEEGQEGKEDIFFSSPPFFRGQFIDHGNPFMGLKGTLGPPCRA
jgi:hypothetical protein